MLSPDSSYHYPPELLELLVDTIASLIRSKKGVVDFFVGAGVPASYTNDWNRKIHADRESVKKVDIARSVLTQINDSGDKTLAQRREVIKRVTQWDDFSIPWPADQHKAQGLVAQVLKVVNVKDSFTRMSIEREREFRARKTQHEEKLRFQQRKNREREKVRSDLNALFDITDPWRRGKALERVLNDLFKAYGIQIRESFILKGNESQGIVEQIDGVIELDAHLYLVEMKWLADPVGTAEVAQHLVRVMSRAECRGVFISASEFTSPAITQSRDFLQHKVSVLCLLEEIVLSLSQKRDIAELFRSKVRAALAERNPFVRA